MAGDWAALWGSSLLLRPRYVAAELTKSLPPASGLSLQATVPVRSQHAARDCSLFSREGSGSSKASPAGIEMASGSLPCPGKLTPGTEPLAAKTDQSFHVGPASSPTCALLASVLATRQVSSRRYEINIKRRYLCLFRKQHSYPHKANPSASAQPGPRLSPACPQAGAGHLARASCRRGSLRVGGPSDHAGSSCCSGVRLG